MRVVLKREVLWHHILRRHLSLQAFARRAGVGGGHLSQILAGKRSPSAAVRAKLIAATETEQLPPMEFDELFLILPAGNSGGLDE